MAFALGFVLGFLLAYLPLCLKEVGKRQRTADNPPDEAAQRRAEQALREYRNFMTYDGYRTQEGE